MARDELRRGWLLQQIPKRFAEMADRRTEGLLREVLRFDTPLSSAVRSAYLQGLNDMAEAIERKPGTETITEKGLTT